MTSINTIKENYKRFSNREILKIAENWEKLRAEVVVILKEEIKKRNLNVELIKSEEEKKPLPLDRREAIHFATFGNMVDFLLVRSLLELYEIPFFTENENMYYLYPIYSTVHDDEVIIYIHKNDVERATNILIEEGYERYLVKGSDHPE